jgi:ADP-L-glycero-D-manno-heptose 6-epimerase
MIVVTGGAGFIGSNIVRGLNQRGLSDILIVDNLEQGEKHLNLNGLDFIDLIDEDDFIPLLDDLEGAPIETVFHQGACTDTVENDGRYMMRVNYEYSKDLYTWCKQRGVRFIYASSAAVYGQGDNGFKVSPECESPLNVYGYSKLRFDQWLRKMEAFEQDSQTVGLRYFNVYGPQENHKGRMASVILHFFEQAQASGKIKVFEGSQNFLRDFIFVEDVVKANLYFYENPEISGIFNLGTGTARSFDDFARAFIKAYPGTEIDYIPFPEDLKKKYQAFTEADMTWAEIVGFSTDFATIEKGVQKYVDVLKNHGGIWP